VTGAFLLAALALQGTIDQGVLVIRRDTLEIGREAFRLTGAPSRGDTSWTLSTTVRFDRGRPVVTLNPVLVVGRDSQPRTLQYAVADAAGSRTILAGVNRTRLTVREVAPGAERAREYHVPGRTVLLDDSVFTLYVVAAWHAGASPVRVTAVYPRGGRQETLTLTDHGVQATTVNRDPARLRRVTITGGAAGPVHVWLAPDGAVLKVDIPERRLRAERLPGD
jgi:hypothetical protein